MAQHQDEVQLTCTPEVLVLNNGTVAADIQVTFPAKYFNKKAVLKVTPVLVFEGGEVAAPTQGLQGVKATGNYAVVSDKETQTITHHVEFPYDARMQQSQLQLRVEVKCPKGPCKEFTLIDANNGAVPTKEELALLAEGGEEADALKVKFGRVIATGVNTLQETLDYSDAMAPEADNYKHVTTVVTKADIAYQINSSNVNAKKATATDDMKALSDKVFENKENDRATQTVYVNGYASPDGPEKFNDKLSNARSESGKKVVEKFLADAGIQIDAAAYGEDWEGFKEAVAASNLEDKNLILQVLNMYDSAAQREAEIKNMASVYNTLKTDVLPQLRRAQVVNSADISGKTDDEMLALVNEGNCDELDLEELLHIAQTKPECAVAALEYAAAKYNDARAYNNLGIAYSAAGQHDKALEAFENAAKAGDTSAELNNNLALAYSATGNTEKAAEYAGAANAKTQALVGAAKGDYSKANALDGYNAAVANYMNGNLDAAKKAIANDNSAKADYLRAVIATKAGNLNEAKTQLDSAISKDASLAEQASKDVNLVALFQ
ncbi:MAG: tetratricopeptide repeat protein [Alistipes sp.]|nr:tetratricopeptide repeat protein [Alistipes sp.]